MTIRLILLFTISFLTNCEVNQQQKNSKATQDTITQREPMSQTLCSLQDINKNADRSRKVFTDILMSIPGPVELSLFAKEQRVNYQPSLISIAVADLSVHPKKRYEHVWLLGAYFTGVTQAWIYQKPKVAQAYLKAIRQLTRKLGITQYFNYSVFNALLTIPDNDPTFLVKITQTYHNILQGLFDLGSANASISAIFMSLGSYTESLYFLVLNPYSVDSEAFWERLGEQKHMLNGYLILLYFFEDMPKVKPVLAAFDELQAFLEQVKFEYQDNDPQITVEDDLIVLNEQSLVKMTMSNYLKKKLPILIKQLRAQQLAIR